MVRFGPSGNEEAFYAAGYKSSVQMPEYAHNMGLDLYEYQCSKGVKITQPTAEKLGAAAKEYGIGLSIHAPYYINLATDDEEKRQNSIKYITDTMQAAEWMGAAKIVVHSGACAKMPRDVAMEYAKKTLKMALEKADELGLGHIHICPETMGKINQLGDLNEVMELCKLDERLLPTIDFGHLNARTFGGIQTIDDYAVILDTIENALGYERLDQFHAHFSRIEYTQPGGEKKHHTFDDVEFGPDYLPLMELLAKKDISPTIVCESAGTMARDALRMKTAYLQAQEANRK